MKDKNSNLNMILILTGVCFISAGVLGLLHSGTRKRIEKNREQRIEKSVYEVIPEIESYERAEKDIDLFKGKSNGRVVGYAVLTGGMGFQGEIELIVGVDKNIENITGVRILESVETPGLGNKITGRDFLNQFENKKIPPEKEIGVDTITGATISSQSVQRIVNQAVNDVKAIY
ncbi:MAG: RnfABCDGE type electron transport complex subunit G [Elusimicrobiota bacterium]